MISGIEHLVVLMMENRSFDHMLGYLNKAGINGIDGSQSNPGGPGGQAVPTTSDAHYIGVLFPDAPHEFNDVTRQIFDTANPAPGAVPTMTGFVHTGGARVMRCFAPEKIPVLTSLAMHYAICTNWFSSVPGPTSPNRKFANAATSEGSVSDDLVWINLRTIYEQLDQQHISYRIYKHDMTFLMTVKHLAENQSGFHDFETEFEKDCANGSLPQYTWIEPRYNPQDNLPANSQHPDCDVRDGEVLIKRVYTALSSNKSLWDKTLLLIVYDEHGGLYDHAHPPSVPPGPARGGTDTFTFDRLGIRVPAILISPLIAKGSIDPSQYEHSSIVATIRALFLPGTAPLTERERNATPFHRFLAGNTVPREDALTFPAPPMQDMMVAPPNLDAPASTLALTMARHVQAFLDEKGKLPVRRAEELQTAQDVSQFFKEATALLATP